MTISDSTREYLLSIKTQIDSVLQDESGLHALKTAMYEFASSLDSTNDFFALKKLLESDLWPEAVFGFQIADENSEKDKEERAEGISDILLPPQSGKRFLDFGCGEGHIANYVSKSAKISVGYDIVKNNKSRFAWEENDEKFLLTTDFKKVEEKGPYDTILIYDVLDHVQNFTPQEALAMTKSVLAKGGKIYLRTHPWTSRHGGHVYKKINKAFVHLVFTEEELKSMGVDLDFNLKVMSPQSKYGSWIEESGLKKSVEPEPDLQDIESFFKDNTIVKKRILNAFGVNEWGSKPEWQMKQCFWDYVLE